MSNRYPRFREVLDHLRDCADHIHDKDLSRDEQEARKRLIECCREIVAETDGEEARR